MRIKDILEDFKDIGKLPDDILNKGHRLSPNEDNFTQVSGRVFHKVLSKYASSDKLRENPKGMNDLSIYGVDEYLSMDCFLGKNNTSGYAVTQTGELVSVFSFMKSSGDAIVVDAIMNGARHLDCFAYMSDDGSLYGKLYELYSRHGFVINEGLTKGGEYPIENGISVVDGALSGEPNVVVYMVVP